MEFKANSTTDEAFQEHCFLWERGTIVGGDIDTVSTFHLFYMHMKLKKTH